MKPIKTSLISGSPKPLSSSSAALLDSLKSKLSNRFIMNDYNQNRTKVSEDSLASISESDILVFSFPLYVDGIPSHFLSFLFELETYLNNHAHQDILVYAIVNCGFYEGHQALPALEMVKNWCHKAGVSWGHGLGVGGGGMIQSLTSVPDGQGPKKNFSMALDRLAANINASSEGENIYITPNFPRIGYKIGAEMGWRHQLKMNGLKKSDIHRRMV